MSPDDIPSDSSPAFSSDGFCQICNCLLYKTYDPHNTTENYACSNCNRIYRFNRDRTVSRAVQTDLEPLKEYWENLKESILEDSACSVCLEPYTTQTHKAVILKCGHLFGDECITRWFAEGKTDGGTKCPTCKSKAKSSDIRFIAPYSVFRADPTLVTKYKHESEKARAERIAGEKQVEKINQEFYNLKKDFEATKQLYEEEKREYERLLSSETERIAAASIQNIFVRSKSQPFVLSKRLDFDNRCDTRVLTVSDMLGVIMIPQKKESLLFPPYGLRNIGSADLHQNEFIPLHQDVIRDVAFHPYDAMVLTASHDKTVKITNIFSSSPVMTFPFEDPAWSCCWNDKKPQYFYVGLKSGKVFEFDMRVVGRTMAQIPVSDKTPCISLKYIYNDMFSGISSTRLKGSEFHFMRNGNYYSQLFPIQGVFMSSHYERKTANFLVSNRPSKPKQNFVNHTIFNLSLNSNILEEALIDIKPVLTLNGGARADQSLKARIFHHPKKQDRCLVIAGDQDIGGFIAWDTEVGECIQKGIGRAHV